jgi:palmitoyl transferase
VNRVNAEILKKRSLRLVVCLMMMPSFTFAYDGHHCDNWPKWLKPVCLRPYQTWTKGNNELYLSGFAWHNRYYYDSEKIHRYNETAWGGGLGKSFYDEDGDWHGLYAFAFLDSHKNVEPVVGYAFLKTAHFREHWHAGLGYALLVTQRPDINHGIPFPGALPWASVGYRRASISATYIPGHQNVGNVLYLVGRWLL